MLCSGLSIFARCALKVDLCAILVPKMTSDEHDHVERCGHHFKLYRHVKFSGTTDVVMVFIKVLYYNGHI